MALKKLRNEHRKEVRRKIFDYIEDPDYPFRIKAYKRTKKWSEGKTMAQIAKDEGVTMQSVAKSVRILAKRILEWDDGIVSK